jgi:hypothetical protein
MRQSPLRHDGSGANAKVGPEEPAPLGGLVLVKGSGAARLLVAGLPAVVGAEGQERLSDLPTRLRKTEKGGLWLPRRRQPGHVDGRAVLSATARYQGDTMAPHGHDASADRR